MTSMMWLLSPTLLAASAEAPAGSSAVQHSVHAEHLAAPPTVPARHPGPPSADSVPRPDVTVYGYHAYWTGDPAHLDFSRLSHVAIFNVDLESDGSLSSTSTWTEVADEVVALAHAAGTKVHLCVTGFDDAELNSVLPSASYRATAVAELAALVRAHGADGVNVDFEGMDASNRAHLVSFVEELKAEVDEVVLATPAVDWQDAYDYAELARVSDGLFIMGYGYHWSSGDPGPVGPLYGGEPWSAYSLAWTVEDYLDKGAPADKIILGLPLYGREWPSESHDIPGTATDSGTAVVMSTAMERAASEAPYFDSVSRTPYLLPAGTQLWYDDVDSTRERIAWAVEAGLQGVGFWALQYEPTGEGFWEMVTEETTYLTADTGQSGTSDELLARAGQSFLAYPGETIVLNGTGSTGPEGEVLNYTWTQVAGPEVRLVRGDTAQPEFLAAEPGTHTFSLFVSVGAQYSATDEVDVIVVDPEAGAGLFSDGCSTAPSPARGTVALGLAGLLLGLLRRRR